MNKASRRLLVLVSLIATAVFPRPVQAADAIFESASVTIDAGKLGTQTIPREITGKFCEHLGNNIYNGMDAQILRNSTFADFPFATDQGSPDGLSTFQFEADKIDRQLRNQAVRNGWSEADLDDLATARRDGLASFWSRAGSKNEVSVSPDTGPRGGRAQ